MFTIPSKENKTFQQLNNGDTSGNIWSSFNIDFVYNKGRINTFRSLKVANISDIATAGSKTIKVPATAFCKFNLDGNDNFVAYAGSVLKADSLTSTYTLDTNTSTPDNSSDAIYALDTDMKVFNSKLYVTTAEGAVLYKTSGVSAWTTLVAGTGNVGFGGNQMQVYGDRLYVVNSLANKIYSISTANAVVTTGSYTLDLSSFAGTISWIQAGSNRIWIGVTKTDGSRGLIFEWDGQSENLWSKNYKIDAVGSHACTIKDDLPYVLDTEGRLLAYTGSGFKEIAKLPLLNNSKPEKLCHFNGMTSANDEIVLNISGALSAFGTVLYTNSELFGYTSELSSGIWKYNSNNGLYHYTSASHTLFSSSPTVLDYGVSFIGTKTNSQSIKQVGAVLDITSLDTTVITPGYAELVYSSSLPALVSGMSLGIFIDNKLVETGVSSCFTTSWMESNQVNTVWNKVISKYKKLLSSTDIISVKYRTVKQDDLIYYAKFTDNSTIKIPLLNSISSNQTDRNLIEIGDEVKVMSGYGAGLFRTITNITVSGTDYILSLDRSLPVLTADSICNIIISKWESLPTISDTEKQFTELSLISKNKDIQIQFKVIPEWTYGNEFYELMVVNSTEQYAK